MRMNKRTVLAPKLRFPEYCDTGEWKICVLGELAKKIAIRNKNVAIKRVLTNSATEGVVDQKNYFDKGIANPDNLENYFIIDEGDYVYNPRISATAPVGPISKNRVGEGVVSPLYMIFRFDNYDNDFYEQYFKTSLWHRYLKSVSNTGARHDRMSISQDNFMKMPLPCHLEEEQQKIADCLSSLDKLISVEKQKLEDLKVYRKGMLQKILPAEEKTLPEWRFPEFKSGDEWTSKKLGEFTNVLMCKRIHTNETCDSGDVPFYKIGTLGGEADAFISRELFNQYKAKYSYPRKGEVLLTCSGTVGKCLSYDGEEAYYQDSNIVWIDNPTLMISNELLLNLLRNINWTKLNSTTITRIYGNDLRNLIIKFPKDMKEQHKISECLSSIDDIITGQTQKIDALIIYKKGLMQGLFPSIMEVTDEQ